MLLFSFSILSTNLVLISFIFIYIRLSLFSISCHCVMRFTVPYDGCVVSIRFQFCVIMIFLRVRVRVVLLFFLLFTHLCYLQTKFARSTWQIVVWNEANEREKKIVRCKYILCSDRESREKKISKRHIWCAWLLRNQSPTWFSKKLLDNLFWYHKKNTHYDFFFRCFTHKQKHRCNIGALSMVIARQSHFYVDVFQLFKRCNCTILLCIFDN